MLPPEIVSYTQEALSPVVCSEIIKAAEQHGHWLRSGRVGYTADNFVGDSRTSSETWVERHEPLLWVRDQLVGSVTRALDKCYGASGPHRYYYESRVIRYCKGEYLHTHQDNPAPLNYLDNPDHGARSGFYHFGRRKELTLVVYLNDNYQGGQLNFSRVVKVLHLMLGIWFFFPLWNYINLCQC